MSGRLEWLYSNWGCSALDNRRSMRVCPDSPKWMNWPKTIDGKPMYSGDFPECPLCGAELDPADNECRACGEPAIFV